MTLKLCIDARMLSSSGIGTFLKKVIPYFSPFETTLLLYQEDQSILKDYPHIFCSAPIYSLKEQVELSVKIPACDLFWSPHYNIPLLPIRAKKRVVTIHDAAHLHFRSSQSLMQNSYAKLMFRQAVSRSDAVVTGSQFSQGELCRYLSLLPTAFHRIGYGVDHQRFGKKISSEQKASLRCKYQLPEEFLLFVGNVKPHKNLKLIAQAYQEGKISLPLVVVGKMQGLLTADPLLQELAEWKDRIHFVGEVLDEEIPLFYQMASLFLFPSLYEGFGLPPLEAMASGCPVIVSKTASLPEVCGDAAHWIDPYSTSDLIAGIEKILSSDQYRQALIEKGYAQAQKHHWDQSATQYVQLFEQVVHSKK